MKLEVYDIEGEKKEDIELDKNIFDIKINEYALYQMVRLQRANMRKGLANTKERSEVQGGGTKPYRQKGTGRARAGTSRSPIRRGGGIAFGPHPRKYGFKLPKKIKKLAYRSALTGKLRDKAYIIVDKWSIDPFKTKRFVEILGKLNAGYKVLIIKDINEKITQVARNVPDVKIINIENINIIDLLDNDNIICSKSVITQIQEMFKNEN